MALANLPLERNYITPPVICGLGEKKSNGGTQWFQQDRIYSSQMISMCLPANIPGGSYLYMVIKDDTFTGK